MRPLLLPPHRIEQPRLAAAQLSSRAPSSAILGKRTSLRGTDGKWLSEYTDWQSWARRYARQIGAASFAATVIADCCARCDIRVEQRVNGEWLESDDPRFVGLMDEYSNPLQMTNDLIRLHAWHYQVAGEMLQTYRDGDFGVEFGIYSVAAAEWNRPTDGEVMIKLVPDGKVDRETAFSVPRDQCTRFWMPDQEWQAYAWSPMAASVEDLKRWRSLARYVMRTADSQLAMSGMLWAAGEAFDGPPAEVDEPLDSDIGEPSGGIEDQYLQAARLSFTDDEDVSAIAPTLVHWDKEWGPPQYIKTGEALDPSGISHRKEALEDFARSSNLPVTTVIGGGVGDANHWSEWLASDKFFDSGVAPTMDRICHLDLTRTYLWRRARIAGLRDDELADIRIGYDPSPVIVKTDQSAIALQLNRAGLLANEATLEAAGFDEMDAMPPGPQRDWLLEVLSGAKPPEAGAPPGAPGPVGPGTVEQVPPTQPIVPPALAASIADAVKPLTAHLAEDCRALVDYLGDAPVDPGPLVTMLKAAAAFFEKDDAVAAASALDDAIGAAGDLEAAGDGSLDGLADVVRFLDAQATASPAPAQGALLALQSGKGLKSALSGAEERAAKYRAEEAAATKAMTEKYNAEKAAKKAAKEAEKAEKGEKKGGFFSRLRGDKDEPRGDGEFDEEKHPRDEVGRWASADREWVRDDFGRFGFGDGGGPQSEGAGTRPEDPVRGVTTADEALALIAEGKYVEMDPDLVAVSIDRMAEIAKEAQAAGEKAPTYDMCNITSENTSLFCGSSVVESRLDMPQLSGVPTPGTKADALPKNEKGEADITKAFQESLAAEGITSTPGEVDAKVLKASQNDLNGAKVAGMMQSMAAGTMPAGTIMVSSDNYVIDGHHRWAANVGAHYTGGAALTMPVVRIDLPIQQVLDRAKTFSAEMGIPQAGMGSISRSRVAAVLAEALLAVVDDDELVGAH